MILGVLLLAIGVTLLIAREPIAFFIQRKVEARMGSEQRTACLSLMHRTLRKVAKKTGADEATFRSDTVELTKQQRTRAAMQEALKSTQSGRALLRALSTSGEGGRPIMLRLVNRQVQDAVNRGVTHPAFDLSWAEPTLVMVNAPSPQEAADLVQTAYPHALGFDVVTAKSAGAEDLTLAAVLENAKPFIRPLQTEGADDRRAKVS